MITMSIVIATIISTTIITNTMNIAIAVAMIINTATITQTKYLILGA
jgi:hypothetical protein